MFRKSHHGAGIGLLRVVAITLLLVVTSSHGHFLMVRSASTPTPMKRKPLLAQQSRSPGYNRNYGVRAGVQDEDMGMVGDDGSKQDSSLGYNVWRSGGMRFNFPFLDNLEPVAPMDRVNKGNSIADMDTRYISEYVNPDAFPTVSGKGCMCESPTNPDEKIECQCGDKADTDHYTWLKDTPVPGTNKFTLEPADITYRHGNYWHPQHAGGIASPAEKLPLHSYPNQAPFDRISPIPASADGDRIRLKYVRYIDQVYDRSQECDGVSDKCTVLCRPGDAVMLNLGNTFIPATVLKTFVGNAAVVEFVPKEAMAGGRLATCSMRDACSAFRFCKGGGRRARCVAQQDDESHDWSGSLVMKHKCPLGTLVCGKVQQVTMANFLVKDGKACRAAPAQVSPPVVPPPVWTSSLR